jgi:hypothetical protein
MVLKNYDMTELKNGFKNVNSTNKKNMRGDKGEGLVFPKWNSCIKKN